MEVFSRWDELWLSMLALVWGTVLVLPGDLFKSIDYYHWISIYFPDWGWGILFLIGGVGIIVIKSNGVRKHFHWLLCTLWIGITVLSSLSSFTIGTLLITSLCWLVAMIHIGKFFYISLMQRVTEEAKLEVEVEVSK